MRIEFNSRAFAAVVRARAAALKLSARELSIRTGVSTSHLHRLNTDQRLKSIEAVLSLAKVLDISLEPFIHDNSLSGNLTATGDVMGNDAYIAALEDQLRQCRKQFLFYAENHRAKPGGEIPGTDTAAKAEANEKMARDIDAVLSTGSGPGPLDQLMVDTAEFHEVFAPDWLPTVLPLPLSISEAETRAKWIRSEANELERDTKAVPAIVPGSAEMIDLMAKQADAFIDAIYFALGGLCRMKLKIQPLWRIVHQQNMAKRNADGTVTRRESDGKVVKPAGWVDPHELLVAEITRQVDAA